MDARTFVRVIDRQNIREMDKSQNSITFDVPYQHAQAVRAA